MDTESPIIVSSTAADAATLKKIATQLLEQRLVACCQISGPVESLYRWQGKIEHASEFVLAVKTTKQHEEAIFNLVRELHPYDEPELVVTPIVSGNQSYLNWIAESVNDSAS